MNFAPYQWRAGPGYIPPQHSVPAPLTPTSYGFFQVPGAAQACRPAYNSPPLPANYAHQVFYPGYPGHGVVAAACTPVTNPCNAPANCNNLPPPKPDSNGACCSGCKDAKPTPCSCGKPDPCANKNPTGHMAPPSLAPGMNYMFAPTHTMLHVFNKGAPIWEDKYKGQGLAFKIFKVSTAFCVGEVIERVMGAKGDEAKEKCKDWQCTEVHEAGDGKWMKGTSIKYGDDKAKGNLGSMGWGEKRGKELPPVWLVVHKA